MQHVTAQPPLPEPEPEPEHVPLAASNSKTLVRRISSHGLNPETTVDAAEWVRALHDYAGVWRADAGLAVWCLCR